jgi:uncharacterized protein (DUF433 family)
MTSRIELNPDICNGRPVIRGSRITVEAILGYLSAGDSADDVLQAHPRIEMADVLACIDYARRVTSARSTVQLAS